MKPRQFKTVLGIDISSSQINMALLRKDKGSLKLLKAASCPVPDGAIKDGNIEDVTVLAKAVKRLKVRNKIRTRHVALSMVINPVMMQILDIRDNATDNVGQFVQDEIKDYATLSKTKIASDYCGIKPTGKTAPRRAFVAATDSQKIASFVKALNKEGLNIAAVEPFPVAYIRACYEKKIAEKVGQNVVFVLLRDNILTLCVFKNQVLNFMESKQCQANKLNGEECFRWIVEKVNELLKFYDITLCDDCDKWKVSIVISTGNKHTKEEIDSLAAGLKTGNLSCNFHQNNYAVELEIKSLEEACFDTPIANAELSNEIPVIAVGLAMKLLNFSNCGLNINLLLPEMVEGNPKRKHTLIIANIAAVALLLGVLSIGFFSMRVKSVMGAIEQKNGGLHGSSIKSMLDERVSLDEKIAKIANNYENMSIILNTNFFVKWDQILNEIRYATPKPVRILNIFSDDGLRIILKGHAFSYESVHLFVQTLNESEHIKLVALIGTEKDTKSSGLVAYSISCSLVE